MHKTFRSPPSFSSITLKRRWIAILEGQNNCGSGLSCSFCFPRSSSCRITCLWLVSYREPPQSCHEKHARWKSRDRRVCLHFTGRTDFCSDHIETYSPVCKILKFNALCNTIIILPTRRICYGAWWDDSVMTAHTVGLNHPRTRATRYSYFLYHRYFKFQLYASCHPDTSWQSKVSRCDCRPHKIETPQSWSSWVQKIMVYETVSSLMER